MGQLADRVVEIARGYVGKKELPNNSGFVDSEFQKKMAAVGWYKGASWCAFTGELIWKEAFGKDHPLWPMLDKLFSGSAVATAANFKASPHFKTGQTPRKGAVVVWKHGNTLQGHLGIVESVVQNTNKFNTIEGNTNAAGGREGIEIAEKLRATGLPFTKTGLNIILFIYLPE